MSAVIFVVKGILLSFRSLRTNVLRRRRIVGGQKEIFYGRLYRSIKTDNSEVLVELTVEPDVFGIGLGQV